MSNPSEKAQSKSGVQGKEVKQLSGEMAEGTLSLTAVTKAIRDLALFCKSVQKLDEEPSRLGSEPVFSLPLLERLRPLAEELDAQELFYARTLLWELGKVKHMVSEPQE